MDTLLAILAILPAAVLLTIIYKADKIEKEPIGLMALVFFLGMVSTATAVILEGIGGYVLSLIFGVDMEYNIIALALEYFLVVACSEELGKYVMLKLATWKNKEFNFAFDGVVYSVCSTLGFAAVENVLYVFNFRVLSVAVVRGILSVPGHCIFGIFMGIYYGIAKGYELRGNVQKMKANLRKAFWIPVGLHGMYDFCLSAGSALTTILFIALEIFMVVNAIKLVKRMSANDMPLMPGVTAEEAINANKAQQPLFTGAQPAYGQQPVYGQQPAYGQPMNGQSAQPQYFQGQQTYGQNPYAQPVNNQAMNGQSAQPQYFQGQQTYGQNPYAQSVNNQAMNNQSAQPQFFQEQQTYRQGAYVQTVNNQPVNNQPVNNQPAQPQYYQEQQTYGQDSYTQDSYAQDLYAQDSYAQDSYAQDANNEPAYEQYEEPSVQASPVEELDLGPATEELSDALTNRAPVFSAADFDGWS